MAFNRFLLISFILNCYQVSAQTNRYFIYFKDKQGTPYSVSDPSEFLSDYSIARRQAQGIAIIEEDLPVNPAYVNSIKNAGVSTFFSSRWFNGVLVEMDASQVSVIAALPIVKSIELVAPGKKLTSGRSSLTKKIKNTSVNEPANQVQLEQIGLDVMHQANYHGEGVRIGVFDSGFQGVTATAPFTSLISEGRVKQTFNFVNNTSAVFQLDDHGTEVLSVMAAYAENSYIGGAYKADYFLYLTEDIQSEYRIEEYNWTFAAERADSAGVDIINSSLGYYDFDDFSMNYEKSQMDGKTAIVTKAARKAIEKGIVVVCSAGNEGGNSWGMVTPPADAEGILASGSINSGFSLSASSSKGPTADNRIKPDVVAMGAGARVIRANGTIGTSSGTSLASPLIASLAAGVRQAYPELTALQIYEAITQSADQSGNPDNLKGYGLPHFVAIQNYLESQRLPSDETIVAYPNPANGNRIYIKLKEVVDNSLQIRILDATGKRIQEINYPISWMNNPFEYDISDLYTGMYFLQIQIGSKTTSIKFIRI